MLTHEGVLNEFTNSCIRHFFNFDAKTKLSFVMIHNIIAREINVEDTTDFEIWFGIGQRKVRFSKVDFCLIIGLKSGEPSSTITRVHTPIECGIVMTYWPSLNLNIFYLHRSFTNVTFQFKKPLDSVKIALVLFVVAFLFGYDYRSKVDPWIFNLVGDIQQFNSFS